MDLERFRVHLDLDQAIREQEMVEMVDLPCSSIQDLLVLFMSVFMRTVQFLEAAAAVQWVSLVPTEVLEPV